MTQRHLARISGVSQPHVHNVLKGIRELTPTTADRFLHCLAWDVMDLLQSTELDDAIRHKPLSPASEREMGVLAHRIGPGVLWSSSESRYERFTLPFQRTLGFWKPVAAHLAFDPEMEGVFSAGDVGILDYCDEFETRRDPSSLYVVVQDGESRVRWIREARRGFYLLTKPTNQRPMDWQLTAKSEIVIEARLHLALPLRIPDVPRRPPGIAPIPARHSAAS